MLYHPDMMLGGGRGYNTIHCVKQTKVLNDVQIPRLERTSLCMTPRLGKFGLHDIFANSTGHLHYENTPVHYTEIFLVVKI